MECYVEAVTNTHAKPGRVEPIARLFGCARNLQRRFNPALETYRLTGTKPSAAELSTPDCVKENRGTILAGGLLRPSKPYVTWIKPIEAPTNHWPAGGAALMYHFKKRSHRQSSGLNSVMTVNNS